MIEEASRSLIRKVHLQHPTTFLVDAETTKETECWFLLDLLEKIKQSVEVILEGRWLDGRL